MTRILALGHGPIPLENMQQGFAPGKRAWQLISPLLDAGHEVCFIASRIPGVYPESVPPITRQCKDNLLYYSLAGEQFHRIEELRRMAAEFQPDCVVGITILPASIAAELNLPLPFWADLYGSVMVEAQVKAQVYPEGDYLNHFFNMEYRVLGRADCFSVVSDRQRYALIGELGLYGRLNRHTVGHELVYVMPAGGETAPYQPGKSVIRGTLARPDDFVVLYSGGYNTWTDVDTLFHGLEGAMAQEDRLVFVSTGGQIAGHDEETFPRFERLVAASRYRDRFHLCGWVDWHDVHNYYLESDVGISVDKICYEALLGSRTRVLDWMRAGLPSVTTILSEVTDHLVRDGAGFAYAPGDAPGLSDLLVQLARDTDRVQVAAERGKTLLTAFYTAPLTARPLTLWAASPAFAPDHDQPRQALMIPNHARQIAAPAASPLPPPATPDLLDVLQPYWQAVIHPLQRSPLAFLVRPLRMLSAAVKKLRPPLYGIRYQLVDRLSPAKAGHPFLLRLRLVNTGRIIWLDSASSPQPVALVYRWRTSDGVVALDEGWRVLLPVVLARGQQVTLDVETVTPPMPGSYLLEFDLVQEGIGWFSDLGTPAFTLPVRVTA